MDILFVSNFINHYQIPLSDELYKLTGGSYHFVETQQMPDSFRKGGFSNYERPYIVRAWASQEEALRARQLTLSADVMIAGGGRFIIPYERERLSRRLLTLEYGERPLKRGLINAFSLTNVLTQWNYHTHFYNKPFYKLCVSGYTANDMYLQHCFKNRCYKFGYFPEISAQDVDKVIALKNRNAVPKIIWCARMIRWKHPELAVLLAEKLVDAGYDFELNMIGSGPLVATIEKMIAEKHLGGKVHLLGNFPNQEVISMMTTHDVFLFTSDRNEGWGVVLNEAMGQLCCPVAAAEIGATPFLLQHNKNGLVFKSGDVGSLFECVRRVLDDGAFLRQMQRAAYQSISGLWTPQVAARRLFDFCSHLLINKAPLAFDAGPLSPAYPVK